MSTLGILLACDPLPAHSTTRHEAVQYFGGNFWREILAGKSDTVSVCAKQVQHSGGKPIPVCTYKGLGRAMVRSRDRSERGCGDHALAAMPVNIDTKLADDQPLDTGLHEHFKLTMTMHFTCSLSCSTYCLCPVG